MSGETIKKMQDDEIQSAQHLVDEAQRLFALKKYNESAEQYALALDKIRQEDHEIENTPALAPILHRYGRSLLESAILTSGALGGGGTAGANVAASQPKASSSKIPGPAMNNKNFSFGGDGDEDEEEEQEGDQDGNGEEEETDLDIAFQVLDHSRVLFEKALKQSRADRGPDEVLLRGYGGDLLNETKIKAILAEVFNDLADAGLESENFLQASEDYASSLQHLSPLVHPHSRRLADAHVRLGLALEYHPDSIERSKAGKNIVAATNVLQARLTALDKRLKTLESGDAEVAKSEAAAVEIREEKAREESNEESHLSEKGKGKGKASEAVEEPAKLEKDDVLEMNEAKVRAEIKDCSEILEDLKVKLDEYNSSNNGSGSASGSSANPLALGGMGEEASATLKKALADAFLSSSDSLAAPTANPGQKVNDLSKMVKKKKKTESQTDGVEAGSSGSSSVIDGKRKAQETNGPNNDDAVSESKRARVEGSTE